MQVPFLLGVSESYYFMEKAPANLTPKLQPRSGEEFGWLPRANCGRRPRQRDQRGNPKGGAALFGQSLPTFCWPESRGPARPERVEGKIKNLREGKEDKRKSPARKTVPAACEVPRRGERVEGINYNFKKRQADP